MSEETGTSGNPRSAAGARWPTSIPAASRAAVKSAMNCRGSESSSSSDSQAVRTRWVTRKRCHSASRQVLPKPAGACTNASLARSIAGKRLRRRWREMSRSVGAGASSLVRISHMAEHSYILLESGQGPGRQSGDRLRGEFDRGSLFVDGVHDDRAVPHALHVFEDFAAAIHVESAPVHLVIVQQVEPAVDANVRRCNAPCTEGV